MKKCPICGEGNLVESTYTRPAEISGYQFSINGLLRSQCANCQEIVTTREQSRHNKRLISEARAEAVDARDRADRLTPEMILRIRKKLGITQAQAARVFGGGTNAFSKYENGEVEPSDGMERLLRLADVIPAAARWLLIRGGVLPEVAQDPRRMTSETFREVILRLSDSFEQKKSSEHRLLIWHSKFSSRLSRMRFGVDERSFDKEVSFTLGGAANDEQVSKSVGKLRLAQVG